MPGLLTKFGDVVYALWITSCVFVLSPRHPVLVACWAFTILVLFETVWRARLAYLLTPVCRVCGRRHR